MIRKTALALVALLAVTAADIAPARATVDIDIRINLGYGGWGVIGVRRGSCRDGLRVVNRRFNFVVARDCRGSVYHYAGRRNGKWFFISVNSRTGRIIDVRRWRR